jgi:hypothetical protein
VLEPELAPAAHHRLGPRRDEPGPDQRRDLVLVDSDRLGPEDPADHRTAPQSVSRCSLQQVDAGGDHAVDGVRDRDLREPLGRDPLSVAALEGALFDEHVQHLL